MVSTMWVSAGRFGTWVPCPQSPLESIASALGTETRLLNGGSHVAFSAANRKQYSLIWKGSVEELDSIRNLYDGIYGDGPFYFIDPTAAPNVLAPHWAAPKLSGNGQWPTLVPYVEPTYALTGLDPNYNLPPMAATYTFLQPVGVFSKRTPRMTIPIPPGQTLRLRIWGSFNGTAAVRINRYEVGTDALTVQNVQPTTDGTVVSISGPDALAVGTSYPSSTAYPGLTMYPSAGTTPYTGPLYSRVELWLGKQSTAASSITLAGISAQFDSLPLRWSPGKGTNGLLFTGDLPTSTYRAWGKGLQSMSASMVEVGSWRA